MASELDLDAVGLIHFVGGGSGLHAVTPATQIAAHGGFGVVVLIGAEAHGLVATAASNQLSLGLIQNHQSSHGFTWS